jgi:hypothetical protein
VAAGKTIALRAIGQKGARVVEQIRSIAFARSPRAPAGGWAPILGGALAEHARAAIVAIAGSVGAAPSGSDDRSLAGGSSGIALFFAYLAQTGLAPDAETLAEQQLDMAIDAVAARQMPPSLYSGFAGVAWAVSHIQEHVFADGADDPNEDIDAALLGYLRRSPWRKDYDLISGLVGFGVYALERLPRPAAVACLEQVIARLAETAQRRDGGITWWTDPRWLPPDQQAECPDGYYNLGLAHGIPGVIALLGAACAAGIAAAEARPLLDGAVAWLMAQTLPDGMGSRFPIRIAASRRPQASRLGWCYGDLGIAAALLYAARCAGESEWEHAALALGRAAAARTPEDGAIVDAGLCHGSAGVAHLFNRLYQASGDAAFAEAARFWFAHTLKLRQPTSNAAGFLALEYGPGGGAQWLPLSGFLTGASGVGLALLAATTTVAPEWDRVLLVSIPPAIR